MPFSLFKRGIKTTSDQLTGDAAIAINQNFIAIANALDQMMNQSGGSLNLSGGTLTGQLTGPGGNTFDDGSGNMTVEGTLTLPGFGSIGPNGNGGEGVQIADSTGSINITLDQNNGGITTNSGTVLDNGSGKMTVAGALQAPSLILPTSTATPAHSTSTSVAGSATNIFTNTEFAGASGSTAYTVNDLVAALKTAGILKT